jgi:hypothetical protein
MMRRQIRFGPSLMNPLFAWQLFGLRVAETLVASSQVIAHRTRRNNTPAQIFEMGNEKMQAAMESSHAMARHWMSMSGREATTVMNAWPHMLAMSLAPFHSRARKNARRIRRIR